MLTWGGGKESREDVERFGCCESILRWRTPEIRSIMASYKRGLDFFSFFFFGHVEE